MNPGKGHFVDSFFKVQKVVFATFCIIETFQGRSGRSKQDDTFFKASTGDGNIAGVVTEGLFLLIRGVMFFINTYDFEFSEGSKDS